ncbi:MAG: hypothetical protein ABIK93_01815 [candidate division WOR-3 bacterium]
MIANDIRFKVFGKSGCAICHRVKEKMEYFRNRWLKEANIDYFDMDTVDGLTEGAFHNIFDIPAVVLEKNGKMLGRWVKTAPTFEELRSIFDLKAESNPFEETNPIKTEK